MLLNRTSLSTVNSN